MSLFLPHCDRRSGNDRLAARRRIGIVLILWTGAGGPIVSGPSLSLSDGQPTHELGKVVLSSLLWPENEGPVVWHQPEGKSANGGAFQCLDENSFEGRIVVVVLEDLLSANGSIQHMEDITTRANTSSSKHRDKSRGSGVFFSSAQDADRNQPADQCSPVERTIQKEKDFRPLFFVLTPLYRSFAISENSRLTATSTSVEVVPVNAFSSKSQNSIVGSAPASNSSRTTSTCPDSTAFPSG